LACDLQFFIFSIIIIVIFNRYIRICIFFGTFVFCMVLQFYLVIKHDYPFNDYTHSRDIQNQIDQFYLFYIRPYVRITPYLVGVFYWSCF